MFYVAQFIHKSLSSLICFISNLDSMKYLLQNKKETFLIELQGHFLSEVFSLLFALYVASGK